MKTIITTRAGSFVIQIQAKGVGRGLTAEDVKRAELAVVNRVQRAERHMKRRIKVIQKQRKAMKRSKR